MWSHEHPLFLRRKEKWTTEETNILKNILTNARFKPNFSLIALCFPGRTGKQIYTKFWKLFDKKEVVDVRYLPPEQEKLIDSLLNQWTVNKKINNSVNKSNMTNSNSIQNDKFFLHLIKMNFLIFYMKKAQIKGFK